MICIQCGQNNVEGNKFCSSCGAKLTNIEDVKPEISLDTAASDILDGNTQAEETVEGNLKCGRSSDSGGFRYGRNG